MVDISRYAKQQHADWWKKEKTVLTLHQRQQKVKWESRAGNDL